MSRSACRLRSLLPVVVVVLLTAMPAAGEGSLPPPKEVGDRVSPMALRDLDGATRELTAPPWKGPLLIFFWSVYCPNCKDAMPDLVRLYKSWRPRGAEIWAVNVDGERFSNGVRAYVQDMTLPFPVVLDRLEGELLVAADALGVSKTPTIFVAGPDGRIRLRQSVDVDYDEVERALEAAVR